MDVRHLQQRHPYRQSIFAEGLIHPIVLTLCSKVMCPGVRELDHGQAIQGQLPFRFCLRQLGTGDGVEQGESHPWPFGGRTTDVVCLKSKSKCTGMPVISTDEHPTKYLRYGASLGGTLCNTSKT